jgi:PAS domain-containing protein
VVGFDGQLEQLDARWRRELDDTAAGAALRYIDLVHADDRDDTLARLAKLTSGQADAVEIENRFLGGNGLYRRLRWRVTAAREQRILYCLADDASDLKMSGNGPGADAQRDLVLGATDAMAVTDADGSVTYMSPASLPLLGYAPKELIGQRMTRLILAIGPSRSSPASEPRAPPTSRASACATGARTASTHGSRAGASR